MMRSNDKGSGIPAHMLHELAVLMDSLIEFCFSSPFSDAREPLLLPRELPMKGGRVYDKL